MTDRDLLEAAAKAAGVELAWSFNDDQSPRERETWNVWNPLTDDGDALRLAVKLGLVINNRHSQALVETRDEQFWERPDNGDDAATRRAIVRAAAAIGAAS